MMSLNARLLKCSTNNRLKIRKSAYVVLSILGLMYLLSATSALAQAPYSHKDNSTLLLSQKALITREEAATIARQGRKVQILKIKKKKNPNGPIYSVKLLTKKGRVKHVRIDAVSGDIINE